MEGWPYGEVIFYGYISIYTGHMEGWLYLYLMIMGLVFKKETADQFPELFTLLD